MLCACPIDDNKFKAGSLGIMEVIKATMERHSSSEQVLEAGLGALHTICMNGTSLSWIIVVARCMQATSVVVLLFEKMSSLLLCSGLKIVSFSVFGTELLCFLFADYWIRCFFFNCILSIAYCLYLIRSFNDLFLANWSFNDLFFG